MLPMAFIESFGSTALCVDIALSLHGYYFLKVPWATARAWLVVQGARTWMPLKTPRCGSGFHSRGPATRSISARWKHVDYIYVMLLPDPEPEDPDLLCRTAELFALGVGSALVVFIAVLDVTSDF